MKDSPLSVSGFDQNISYPNLGNDSSLFDSSDGSSLDSDLHPVISAHYSPRKQAQSSTQQPSKMVREREPPRPAQASNVKSVRQPVEDAPVSSQPTTQQQPRQPLNRVAPLSQPAQKPRDAVPGRANLQQAEFGKASPLRNPLKKDYSNVFNPNKGRAELHRPAQTSSAAPTFRDPRAIVAGTAPPAQPQFYRPGDRPHPGQQQYQQQQQRVSSNPLYAPMQNPLYARGAPQPIRVPTNAQPRNIPAAPRPVFSTAAPNNAMFATSRPPGLPKKTVDLTNDDSDDDEDGFDPDAALRQDKFGAVDPYAYVDASQTGENIKALLEGAFEDDEDAPKLRLRKRAKKVEKSKVDKKVQSLEDKLKQLDIDAAKKEEGAEEKAKPEPEEKEEEEEDEEDGSVEGLTVNLLPHQVEGVAWMTDKEIGVRKKNGVLPKGGILADDMGLGKTVQSVALILTNPRPALDAKPPAENPKQKMPRKEFGKGTLVVAPLALIKQWEAEIKDKVEKEYALRVLVHHGPSRTKSHNELKKYDVVVTTYQILASEHAASSDNDDGPKMGCFGVHWYRVILDEAHSIKNRNAKSTQACCALRSWYRWCLTGTPMQNNLDELQSLICFLRIKPYNNLGTWKDQIIGPMKNGKGQIAIKRIQYFLKGFMKRRTKDILKKEGALNFGGKSKGNEKKGPGMRIVKRDVETITCELDPRERDFYDQLQERAQNRLNDMMAGEKADYIGALVLLLRLRQACNHPQLISGAMNRDKDALSTGQPAGNQTPRKTFNSVEDELDALTGALGGLTVEAKLCDVCNVKLTLDEMAQGRPRCIECDEIAAHTPAKHEKSHKKHTKQKIKPAQSAPAPALRARNRRVVLDSDDEDDNTEGEGSWLVDESQRARFDLGRAGGTDDEDAEGGGETLGSIDTVDNSGITVASESGSESASDASDYGASSDPNMPFASTKIRKLLRILHTESPEHKTIVFSQFTSMLDLIEPHLKKASIKYVRYDGSMKNDAREAALSSLRNNKSTRVLLCSLKCGSLGLNLTAASRVVIVEPFWNPFVEEQAIDRVHRLNQTIDVKVFKLTVGNTVEERILELQEKKRELAKAAIEGGKAVAKLTMKDLMSLFGRNAEDSGGHDDEVDKGKIVDYSMPKIARADQDKRRGGPATAGAGGERPQVGWSNGRLSFDRNDRRGGYERGSGGRVRNEDPVYGRR